MSVTGGGLMDVIAALKQMPVDSDHLWKTVKNRNSVYIFSCWGSFSGKGGRDVGRKKLLCAFI